MFIALQWLWVLALGLPIVIETGILDSLTPPQRAEQPIQSSAAGEPSLALAMFAGAVTLVFLALTIYVLIKLPKTITKTGEKIVHQTSEAVIPVITHHKKIAAKKKRLLSRRIMAIIQSAFIIVPLAASFFIPAVQTITSQIITTLAIWLAGVSVLCLAVSWLLEPKATSQTRSRASRG